MVVEVILTQNLSKIAQLVDRLDHPDAIIQRSTMDELVALGSRAVPALTANLNLVNVRIRRGLVQVLGELGDARALLPLMRYVFDNSQKIEEADGRALAMKSIIALADGPDDRIFSFAIDMTRDADAFVRAYALDLLVALRDRRGLPYAQDALTDAEDIVKKRASLAVRSLEKLDRSDDSDLQTSASDVIQNILQSSGNQREFNIQELLARPDAFSLAVRLIREEAIQGAVGLRTLQQLEDPRARQVATRTLLGLSEPSSAQLAIGLRIIAKYLQGDATSDERTLIEHGLYHDDRLVRLAALEAAASSGVQSLLLHSLNALQTSDTLTALTVAENLAKAPSSALANLFSPIETALSDCRERRLAIERTRKSPHVWDANDSQIRLEAFLLRTIANILLVEDIGESVRERAKIQAFASLRSNALSISLPPIDITALEVLERATAASSLPADTWPLADILLLFEVHARLESSRSRRRARKILKRVVPEGCEPIVPFLQRWRRDPEISLTDDVIVLLERARSEEATRILEELARDSQEDVRQLASGVLRRWRNDAPFIDVSFENSRDENEK